MPCNISEVLDPVFKSGTITQGPQAAKFESEFQKYIGNPNTALVNSGTSAITLALKLAGVGPGTNVISTPMTCLATNEPVLTLGADIIWCDIDPTTGNMDVSKLESLITNKTKAILFVDWGGTPAELDAINRIAAAYGLKTIEDAAHALGATYNGRSTGTSCDYSCFSFQAIKHMSTVDGGALACRNKEDYDRAVLLRWFGLPRNHNKNPVCWEGDVFEPGFKMHMNDVNATIGLEQLKYIDKIVSTHRKNGVLLGDMLRGVGGVELCKIPEYIHSSYWIYTIKLKGSESRSKVSQILLESGIASSITHTRNDAYSMFNKYKTQLDGMDYFSDRMLNIPCGWWVTDEDVRYIADTVAGAVRC